MEMYQTLSWEFRESKKLTKSFFFFLLLKQSERSKRKRERVEIFQKIFFTSSFQSSQSKVEAY